MYQGGVVLISFRIPVTNQETREFQVGVSFLDSSKSSRKDLWRVGTNTWVSGMRILHADTLTRLCSESTHEPQTFLDDLRKQKNPHRPLDTSPNIC